MKTTEIETKNQFHEAYLIFDDPASPSPRLKTKQSFIRILLSNLQTPVKSLYFKMVNYLALRTKRCSIVTIA